MDSPLVRLLAAAVRAPSGDNTQPWHFHVDSSTGTVAFLLDPTRDSSPMNSGQRMARIAVGAALENLLRTARHNGWEVGLDLVPGPAVALVRLNGTGRGDIDPEAWVTQRVTNRRLYDSRAVPAEVLTGLKEQTPDLGGVSTFWVTDRERLPSLASLIARADLLMFGDPSMRKAFLGNVRFDVAPDAEVEQGLSLASLELIATDRIALRLLSRMPDWLVRLVRATRAFAAKTRQLVLSASGLCLVTAPDGTPPTDVIVGRAMQRAWLAMTASGLAVQPMMSICVLENVLQYGSQGLLSAIGENHITALRDELLSLTPEMGSARRAFLMRFGYAPLPSGRTGRLAVESVTTF